MRLPAAWAARSLLRGRFRARIWTGGAPVSNRFRAGRPAGGVEVAQYLRIGGQQTCLRVGNAALSAERPHGLLGVTQARPRHRREQVVLNLVVKAAEGEIGKHAAADVA
jgi:hypothetical protein